LKDVAGKGDACAADGDRRAVDEWAGWGSGRRKSSSVGLAAGVSTSGAGRVGFTVMWHCGTRLIAAMSTPRSVSTAGPLCGARHRRKRQLAHGVPSMPRAGVTFRTVGRTLVRCKCWRPEPWRPPGPTRWRGSPGLVAHRKDPVRGSGRCEPVKLIRQRDRDAGAGLGERDLAAGPRLPRHRLMGTVGTRLCQPRILLVRRADHRHSPVAVLRTERRRGGGRHAVRVAGHRRRTEVAAPALTESTLVTSSVADRTINGQ